MTGSMIGIFVFNPANGWYHEFGTHDPIEILTEYANFTGPSERRRDAKVSRAFLWSCLSAVSNLTLENSFSTN